ncbi:hypothetical protein Cch02nite_45630 [Catellatospora chokoriensis]|uniref:Uncharacterized protein n=2 Tax=Catellatospora chokoriensis TaxID=310353 RepID=A0A8J3K9P8_9ACTN|nr:hypothetical protein Cch02nite_45630 [Catellatospora chokoriensis]
MQIIEVTEFWVRSAVIRLRHRESPLQFVIYSMVHMAEPAFYEAVTARLGKADVVLAEGIRGNGRRRSPLLGALTLSYTALRFNRRMKLVKQAIDYRVLDVPVINPDVTTEEFADDWHKVPLRHRLAVWCVLPVVVLVRLFGGTRVIWSKSMEVNDLPSPEEEDRADALPPEVDAAFAGTRDDRLLAALYRLHEERGDEPIEVAVVYGAGHVAAIVEGLTTRLGYKARSADWLTVAVL